MIKLWVSSIADKELPGNCIPIDTSKGHFEEEGFVGD